MRRELDTPLARESIQCRITLLVHETSQKIAISYSHVVGDGSSGMYLMKDLLNALTGITSDMTLPLLPYVADLFFNEGVDEKTQKIIEQQIAEELEEEDTLLWVPHDVEEKSQPSHGVVFGNISGISGLLKQCREHNVTIGSAIIAGAQFALAKYAAQKGEQNPEIDVEVDFNIRKRLDHMDLGDDYVGMLIGISAIITSINPETEWWTLCKQNHNALQEAIKEKQYRIFHNVVNRLDEICYNDEEYMEEYKRNGQRFGDVNVSNIGKFPFDTHFGEYKLESLYTTGGTTPEGVNYLFLINTVEQEMCFSLVYDASLTTEKTANQFLESVILLLQKCASGIEGWTIANFV
jgi:hypothetical protein